MAENQKDDFEFEIEGEEREVTPVQKPNAAPQQESKGIPSEEQSDVELEIEDDTPPIDRNRYPLDPAIVKDLESDELEEYSARTKERMRQMKRVWHDERRAKEAADRERAEALEIAKRLYEENQKLRGAVNNRENALAESMKEAAERALSSAKDKFRQAYESGDAEQIAEAQEKLMSASIRYNQSEQFKPTPLQEKETGVNIPSESSDVPRPDPKAASWREKNTWFGPDRLMTAFALGLHEELVAERGMAYATTDEYYDRIDRTVRAKFPERFGEEVQTTNGGGKPVGNANKPATVVAPASRSTSSKKIVLKQSEVTVARKFGLTPEQYAREKQRLENRNG